MRSVDKSLVETRPGPYRRYRPKGLSTPAPDQGAIPGLAQIENTEWSQGRRGLPIERQPMTTAIYLKVASVRRVDTVRFLRTFTKSLRGVPPAGLRKRRSPSRSSRPTAPARSGRTRCRPDRAGDPPRPIPGQSAAGRASVPPSSIARRISPSTSSTPTTMLQPFTGAPTSGRGPRRWVRPPLMPRPGLPTALPMAPSPVSITQYGCSAPPYDWNRQPRARSRSRRAARARKRGVSKWTTRLAMAASLCLSRPATPGWGHRGGCGAVDPNARG